tara:strand:- start:786 stop:1547 length:762 start_codon:yes stop_codon:yes gene_type:complete
MNKLTNEVRPDIHKTFMPSADNPIVLGDVPQWSYSRLKNFEECPYKVFIDAVKKIKQPSGPAAERGTEIHDAGEQFVKGDTDLLRDEYSHFDQDMRLARDMYSEGKAEVEGEWGFTTDWKPTGWMDKDTWARIKLDLLMRPTETSARVVDYKTGKKIGNELSHKQQGNLYAVGTFMRYPEIEYIEVEFWYLDQNDIMRSSFTRESALKFLPVWNRRALALTTATTWKPTPSPKACRFCSYGKGDFPECRSRVV